MHYQSIQHARMLHPCRRLSTVSRRAFQRHTRTPKASASSTANNIENHSTKYSLSGILNLFWPLFGKKKDVHSPDLRSSLWKVVETEFSTPALDIRAFGPEKLKSIEAALGYSFIDQRLLCLALWHSSAGGKGFLRLAFIGDAALRLAITEELMAAPEVRSRAELSIARSQYECRKTCSWLATRLGLEKHLVVGKSLTSADVLDSINMTGECFEAVLGAVYIDGGYDAARLLIRRMMDEVDAA